MKMKQTEDSHRSPDPGRNMPRRFYNAMTDLIKSPVDFEKQTDRKSLANVEGPHEKTFELYNLFPRLASKYKNVNMAPNFDNYSWRVNEAQELKKANAA